MRRLVALIGVCAIIGLAAPAYGDPEDAPAGDDGAFLAALRGEQGHREKRDPSRPTRQQVEQPSRAKRREHGEREVHND